MVNHQTMSRQAMSQADQVAFEKGGQVAAWFKERFGDEILRGVAEVLQDYRAHRNQVASELSSNHYDEKASETVRAWLRRHPPQLSHAYEVLAPSTARPGQNVVLPVVVEGPEEPFVVGEYSVVLNREGRITEDSRVVWDRRDFPVPLSEAYRQDLAPSAPAGALGQVSGMFSSAALTVQSICEAFDQRRQETPFLFYAAGQGVPRETALAASGAPRLPQGLPQGSPQGLLESSRTHAAHSLRSEVLQAYRRGGSNMTKIQPIPEEVLMTRYETGDEQYFQKLGKMEPGVWPSWFTDLRTGAAGGGGRDITERILRYHGAPLFRAMENYQVGLSGIAFTDEDFWFHLANRLRRHNYLAPSCADGFKKVITVDARGLCKETTCMKCPQSGFSGSTEKCPFQSVRPVSKTLQELRFHAS